MDNLNDQQKEVTSHRGSPLVCYAAAGTGKTQALTCRIASLIKDDKVPPEKIVALTFTRKAAREMKERAAEYAGISLTSLCYIVTFHSFCLQMLRRYKNNSTLKQISQFTDDK